MKKTFLAILFATTCVAMSAQSCCGKSGECEAEKASCSANPTDSASWAAHFQEITAPLRTLTPETPGADSIAEACISLYCSEVLRCCEENMDKTFPGLYLNQAVPYLDKAVLVAMSDEGAAFLTPNLCRLIDSWRAQLPGTPVLDLTIPDVEGKPRSIKEFVGNGRYVLVDFWASWCGPCRAELPNVKAAYEKYHAKGFDVLGISLDNKKDAWLGAIEKLGLTWQQLSDLKGWECEAARAYGVTGIPATILFDGEGKIVASDIRGEELQKVLAEIFGE